MRGLMLGLSVLTLVGTAHGQADPGRTAFRELYKEMVEIDSSATTGSCTKVVHAVETRLKAAGYGPAEYEVVIPDGKPNDGNIVAWIKGSGSPKKAVLLLAHIDVVDARREDWERDPFKLVEENGFFYGRGSSDDKAQAAIFLDMMVRYRKEGLKPKRDLKLALTCGEESGAYTNGVDYILKNKPALLDAGFALNEGAGGLLSKDAKPLALQIQAGEKVHQVVQLEVTNPGGHSSLPRSDNAIYQLASALKKVEAYKFPIELTPVTQAYFEQTGPLEGGKLGAAMTAFAKNPKDAKALAALEAEPNTNAVLHTTCVATRLDAGHADNALPQRAKATLSCRVMQGTTGDQLKTMLEKAIGDSKVAVSISKDRKGSKAPELTDEVMIPIKGVASQMWPGLPIVPTLTAGATDGRFLMNAGIPTYGLSGLFAIPGENNLHGLNEKVRVKSLYDGRDFLDAVVRSYVGLPAR
jgi:acetylornithine deacetylase/succinyl-diaminopimelate desuccinylase-like protein